MAAGRIRGHHQDMEHRSRGWWAVGVVGGLSGALLLGPVGVGGRAILGAARAGQVAAADASGPPAITTVAGDGEAAFAGYGGQAPLAALARPSAVAVDGQGNL